MWYIVGHVIWYLILVLIILYILLKAIFKLKFHFWSIQPVFHIYDIHHWLNPYKLVDPELPQMNKYVNIIDIKTKSIEDLSEKEINVFCNFLKEYYLRTKGMQYLPDVKHVMEYLKASNHSSFISFYTEPKLLFDKEHIITDKDTLSVISARPLHVSLKGMETFPTYYVDNLCVKPSMRKKGIAPKIIQTLYYDIRRGNHKIKNCLFKREGEMTAIVPLTTFACKCYDTKSWGDPNKQHASMQLIEIGNDNLTLLAEYIFNQKNKLNCVILPEITNIAKLIKNENISVYGIINNDSLISLYLFRDSATIYKDDKALDLVGSINSCPTVDIFINGFKTALSRCCKKYDTSLILIDELGANNLISLYAKNNNMLLHFESIAAFFFYNYVSYTIPPNECFIFY
tara:strand:+ start:3324 stop:4523 length:1200 start_codon:yes stop_codon:yes gene_type:complete